MNTIWIHRFRHQKGITKEAVSKRPFSATFDVKYRISKKNHVIPIP